MSTLERAQNLFEASQEEDDPAKIREMLAIVQALTFLAIAEALTQLADGKQMPDWLRQEVEA